LARSGVKRAVAIFALALIAPGLAAAHVIVSPPFVNDGVETKIAFMTPNERPPHATVLLRATAPPGVEIVSATAPAGWRSSVAGSTVTWSGGRLTGRTTTAFPLRVLARVRAGTYAFKAAQTYDDGATVRWNVDLSVLPASGSAAPSQDPWGAVTAAFVGVVVIAGTLIGVRLLRRRSTLQDP
jgi:uncharacterized protein YcnI